MRLSISARIFLGFLIVLAALGGVLGYMYFSTTHLREELRAISKTNLQLTRIVLQLRTSQANLLKVIDERKEGQRTSDIARRQVRDNRKWRIDQVERALAVVRGSRKTDVAFLDDVQRQLLEIRAAYHEHEPLFDKLFTDDPVTARTKQVGELLLGNESRLDGKIRRLDDTLRDSVEQADRQVDTQQRRTFWAILALAVVALVVSLAVTVGAQITLRPLKTLVAGVKRIGSGDYAHRVEVTSRDELGLLGEEFNSMASAIEEREQLLLRSERLAAAGQIASHITHEIRNPLSSISLNTELLEEEFEELAGDSAHEARKLCQAMRREVDRLTDITEEYLRFARLPQPHLEREQVNSILLDLIRFVGSELEGRRVRIEHELQPDLPAVQADENMLRQAFLNLVRNAGEAMDGADGVITVTTSAVDRAVEIRVADTGVGIEREHLAQVFEPFFSTKQQGTGLGLALTHRIVQEHGGQIEVDSAPGEGTVFTVRLPRHSGDVEILERADHGG